MFRVLIAEDERLVAFVMRGQLEAQGYQVVGIASTGVEALEKCKNEHPEIILMDVQMPEMDGIEATQHIMQECPTTVIMVSANGDSDQIMTARKAGALAYLVKPVNERLLAESMAEAHQQFHTLYSKNGS